MGATTSAGGRPMKTTERATARLDLRLRPSEREIIERAAVAARIDLSELVVEGALRYSRRLLAEHRRQSGAVQKVLEKITP